MSKIILRKYQEEAISQVIKSRNNEVCVELAMGLGKSLIIAELTEYYVNKGFKVLIMTTFAPLVKQLKNHLSMEPRIFQSDKSTTNDSQVALGLEQTMYRRLEQLESWNGCIVLKDEGRGYGKKRTSEILDYIKPSKLVHFNATPYDAKGVTLYPNAQIVNTISSDEAVLQGYSTKIKHFVPYWTKDLDFSHIKTSGGDYSSDEVEKVMDMEWYQTEFKKWINSEKLGLKKRHTIIVTSSIKACEMVAGLIEHDTKEDGLFAKESHLPSLAVVHSQKSDAYNDKAIELFKKGDIDILVAVSKISVGFDSPIADTLINLRATTRKALFNQIIFRINRVKDGKEFATHYDCSNGLMTHGFPETEYIAPFSKEEAKKIAEENKIIEVKGIIDEDNEEVTPKILMAYRAKIAEMRRDLSNLDVGELINVYESEKDLEQAIIVGSLIYEEFYHPIPKATVTWIIDEALRIRATILEVDLYDKMMKKQLKRIIKDNKKFAGLFYTGRWLVGPECYVPFTKLDGETQFANVNIDLSELEF